MNGIVVNRNKPPPVAYNRTSSASYRNLVYSNFSEKDFFTWRDYGQADCKHIGAPFIKIKTS